MKKTLNIDARLLAEARATCGAATDTETIHHGLKEILRRAAYRRLIQSTGAEPGASDVPRRRNAAVGVARARS